ncbi:MAG: acetylglutamate kinase [Paludibacter sp.]|jgi:acetylglutamate kinase|nr:acetylglutamate kinase [Paludibacter sp.]
MTNLTIIKVGGQIVEEPQTLQRLLADFAAIKGCKLLVHGGGRAATNLAVRLGIETKMTGGRRITDGEMLEVVTMVYGGLVNKRIVAGLQALGVNAFGLTGADLNCIFAEKRPVSDVDYGFVGDVKKVNAEMLTNLLTQNTVPVLAPLTHDGNGNLLNTNADTIAAETAKALAPYFDVKLVFCFEKKGVLRDENDDESVISHIDAAEYQKLVEEKIVKGGMLPKIESAFAAIKAGVKSVIITRADLINTNTGTEIV